MSGFTPRWVRDRRRMLRAYAKHPPRVILGADAAEFTPDMIDTRLMVIPDQAMTITSIKPRRRR